MSLTAHKLLAFVSGKAAGNPDAAQLEAINAYALTPLTADQVYVRTAYLAHNGIDRDQEAFSDALLADFARTLPGKGLFVKHPGGWDGDSGPGVGRWFAATVVEMSLDEARAALKQPGLMFAPGTERAKLLQASFYIPRSGKNADLIGDIDAGVAGDVSIGFMASKRAPIEDAVGGVMGSMLFGPGEALEGSLVWLGAQPGARVTKAAKGGGNTEDDEVELKDAQQKITKLEADLKAAEQLAEENAKKAGKFDAVKAAVGDAADKPEELKAAVDSAKAYRKALVGDLVKFDRQQGLVGDTADDTKAAEALYDAMPLETLKARAESARKKLGGSSGIDGGDPNGKGGEQQEQKAGELSAGRAALL